MAAQDAELKLKVSLDLAFFRQQLNGLGQVAAGTPLKLQVQFDRRAIQKELANLRQAIGRGTYRIEIGGNIDSLPKKIENLREGLRKLKGEKVELDVGANVGSVSQKEARKIRRDLREGIVSRGGKILVPATITPAITNADVTAFKRAVTDKLSGITVKVKAELESASVAGGAKSPSFLDSPAYQAELQKIAKANAQVLAKAAASLPAGRNRQEVERLLQAFQSQNPQGASRSAALGAIRELIARGRYQQGLGFEASLQPLRGQRQTSAARSMPNLNEMLDRIANLTSNPRAAQRMLRMMPESRITTDLVGAANRQAAFQQQFPQGFSIPGFNAPKAFDPLLKAIAKDFSDYARTVNISDPWVGQIGNGIAQVVAKAASAPQAQKLLPAIGGTTSPLNTLEARLAASRGMLGTGGGTAASLFTGRGLINPGVSMLGPVGISGNYRQMAAALANQAANPALAHRQIADIGFGAVPTSATGLSGQALNAALNQAFLQRRGLGIGGAQSMPIFGTGGVAVQQNIPGMAYRMNAASSMGGSMGQFPVSGMMGPSSPMTINARSSMFAGGGGGAQPPSGGRGVFGGMGDFGGFGRALGGINLPGTGTIKELGGEFAFATKQVLLFGQAYKMLGIIQDFPAQVGAAVGQLQSFRNTLNAISPSADEARASNELILDLMNRYNVPLQSARDGFTKLYASMAPAGFSGDEIRDLFTGITQAAATFGMSADKVDRVNYAFAQMASKGQIMSEELKGQLGDVLPGAMALFAEAAGFEGPKAIQEFSAALEDGAYQGEAMVALLKNVGIVMKQEFGPGAEGAARTFQGVINRMQNSMTLLYESFEPAAVGFLNTVVAPMTDGIKQLSDGFKAFFTGAAAQTTGGFAIAQELERLRPAFDGIATNIKNIIPIFQQFGSIALNLTKTLLDIAASPFVGYLLRVYAVILPLNLALQLLNLRILVPMIANFLRSAYALSVFTIQCVKAGQAAAVTGLAIKTAGITLRTFFATTGVGLILVGIGLLIEKFISMNQALADTRAKALGAAEAIRSMSQTEARAAGQQAQTAYQTIGSIAGRKGVQQPGGDRLVPVSERELKQLQGVGAIQAQRDPGGQIYVKRSEALSLAPQAQRLKAEASYRERQVREESKQAQATAALTPIPAAEGDGAGRGGKGRELDEYNRSQLQFIKDQFAIEKQRLDKQLQGQMISQTQYDIALAELELESSKLEIAERYRLEVEKTNKDNLSAADKALKLKDLEINKNNALVIAEDKRNLAIGAARQKIIKPIIDEIDKETRGIERQALQMEGLKQGRLELTSAQEAELMVKERYADLAADERDIAQGELDLLKQIISQRLENVKLLEKQTALTSAQRGLETIGTGLQAGFTGSAANVFERAMEQYGDRDYATQLANIETAAMQLRSVFEGLQGAIQGVSSAFANVLTEGVTNMIAGTATAKEVFASFLQSVGQALSQAASQMIATYIAIGIAKMFAGLGGGGQSSIVQGVDVPVSQMPAGMAFANGGIAPGGFQAFANGGVVSGPTLGLVGEGRYNEAVVPLPNGRAIPVQINEGRSARDVMGRNAPGMAQAPTLNLKFESTKINGVEYVSRDQLEQAMAETRRASIAGGASRGMAMTLDKIQQNPSVRSRLGMR